MKLLKPAYLYLFALIIIIGSSCSSGKSAYENGNYYDAVMTAANRLCRNPGHRKSSKTLCAAYPLALKYHDERVSIAITSNVEFKWREVVQQYTLLQSMYDQIQRCPGSSAVISKPISYQVKLADARQKAAEESYNAGIMALGMGDRANAKKAYYLFVNTNDFVPGYKDVSKRIEQALAMATIKVAVEPIPVVAKNYALDAHYFDSKLNEYLVSNQANEFVKYYKMADAKSQRINPDHIVQLTFEEFSIGQVYVNEKESQVERDSVVVAYTVADTKGNLQSTNTEVPVIKPVTGVAVGTTTQNPVNSGETAKTESKTIQTEKSNEVTPVKTEEKAETKTEVSKSDNTTTPANKTEDVKVEEKKPIDSDNKDVKTEEKKSDEGNNVAVGVGVGVGVGVVASDKSEEKKEDANRAEEQVTICHQPPGNPDERKTLKVPQSALKAHLAHGDVTGDCSAENITEKKSDSKDGDKKEEKSEEKKTETDKKSDDKNAVGVGVAAGAGVVATDKQDEKSDDKKSDGKESSDKKDEKTDAKPDGSDNGDKNEEKKENASKAEEHVTICHQPPGKPSERKTLTVPQSAVKAHLAHGDVIGECKTEKKDDKGKDKGKDGGGEGMASLSVNQGTPIMIASVSSDRMWYLFNEEIPVDTTKVFGKVKATVRQYEKTITSRGVLNFRILDAKTHAVISEQRMPSESVWVSEWLTYNGDSRALTPEQMNLAKRKEAPAPSNQELFAEFSKPLFDQITNKLVEFYKNY